MMPTFDVEYFEDGTKLSMSIHSSSISRANELMASVASMSVSDISINYAASAADFINGSKWKTEDIIFFTESLYEAHIQMKLPPSQAMSLIVKASPLKSMKDAARLIQKMLTSGVAISEAVRRTGRLPKDYCDMLELGEISGNIKDVLENMMDYYSSMIGFEKEVNKMMLMPKISLGMAFFVVTYIFLSYIPSMTQAMDIETLRPYLQGSALMSVNISDWIIGNTYLYFGLSLGVVIFSKFGSSMITIPEQAQIIFYEIPILKNMFIFKSYVYLFSSMSMMLRNGTQSDQALLKASESIGSPKMRNAVIKAAEDIKHGGSVAKSLSPILDEYSFAVIEISESAGKLPDRFNSLYKKYDTKIREIFNVLLTFLSILVLLIIGGVIALLFLTMLGLSSAQSSATQGA